VGIVSERIDPATGKGRVLVEGEDWRAASLMDTALEPGTRVMVVRVEGATLYVDKET
jgi:membrane protein implicated in regulation of membrane protease activity